MPKSGRRNSKTPKAKSKDFFHERCVYCGGVFEKKGYFIVDLRGEERLNFWQLAFPTDESPNTYGFGKYNMLECRTCGLAIFVRERQLDNK